MAVSSSIQLPRDHYAHEGAPAEWWWHIGTLRSGDRVFGFEVNATGRADGEGHPQSPFGFTQLMVTDVENGMHYQRTDLVLPLPAGWAEADPSKPWSVKLGSVSMLGEPGNCSDMTVTAAFADQATGVPIAFDLRFVQSGPPLLVWGTGCHPVDHDPGPPLEHNNYYYSFTRLAASGTIHIGEEIHAVEGVTWMDHEYGAFPPGTDWILQDMQLSNGVDLSSFAVGETPAVGVEYASTTTILSPDGQSTFVDSCTTPLGPVWTDPQGVNYCQGMQVVILQPPANLTVRSLFDDQEFPIPGTPIYEGVASVTGTFDGEPVSGTAWLEQMIPMPAKAPAPAAVS